MGTTAANASAHASTDAFYAAIRRELEAIEEAGLYKTERIITSPQGSVIHTADGKDVSWLWDVDFEQLRGRRVICSGPRAYDLAVRLEYGDVTHEVISDVSDAVRAVRGTSEPVDVIATYTPFQKLLKMAGLR